MQGDHAGGVLGSQGEDVAVGHGHQRDLVSPGGTRIDPCCEVTADQVDGIREFIRPFCVRDPNATGEIPEYTITTLQLDSPDYALYEAKETGRDRGVFAAT